MNMKPHWLVLLTAAFAAGSLWAAEPTAPPTQQPATKPVPAEAGKQPDVTTAAAKPEAKPAGSTADAAKPEAAKADKSEAAQTAAKPTEKAAPTTDDKSSPQRFIPSEQVRADFDVSFPIDI